MWLNLKAMEKTAKISKKNFEKSWELAAIEYREIMRILADIFQDWDCEMTHSEYFTNEDGKTHLILCMDFFNEEEDNKYKQFATYIRKNKEFIEDLRNKFLLSIWFNYWESQCITITEDDIINISHKKFMSYDSKGKIPYRSLDWHKKVNNLLDQIHDELYNNLANT